MIKKKTRLKARLRKSKTDLNKNLRNLFEWVKGAEIIELEECKTEKDPIKKGIKNNVIKRLSRYFDII